jgi:trans-aconitate methyltransferase
VLLTEQVGCGAGNTIFPVIASYPDAFVYACDFSPLAIELVKVRNLLYVNLNSFSNHHLLVYVLA